MQKQAGTRYIGAMSNGKFTRTTHYKDRDAFLVALDEMNHDAHVWGDELYIDVSPVK